MTPIPDKFWVILKAWLEAKHTGQIVLHVKEGQILVVDFTATVR